LKSNEILNYLQKSVPSDFKIVAAFDSVNTIATLTPETVENDEVTLISISSARENGVMRSTRFISLLETYFSDYEEVIFKDKLTNKKYYCENGYYDDDKKQIKLILEEL